MNLYEKIITICSEVEQVRKTKPTSGLKYAYHSHTAVLDAVRDLLIKNGIVTLVSMEGGSCVVTLTDGETSLVSTLDVPRPNDMPQSTGAIISYAVKIVYQKTFMIQDDSPDVENMKPRALPVANSIDSILTQIAQAPDKESLDTLARNLDESSYSKEQWRQLANMYKERLNAVANSNG